MGVQLFATAANLQAAGIKRLEDTTYPEPHLSSSVWEVDGKVVPSYIAGDLVVDHRPNRWIVEALDAAGCPYQLI